MAKTSATKVPQKIVNSIRRVRIESYTAYLDISNFCVNNCGF